MQPSNSSWRLGFCSKPRPLIRRRHPGTRSTPRIGSHEPATVRKVPERVRGFVVLLIQNWCPLTWRDGGVYPSPAVGKMPGNQCFRHSAIIPAAKCPWRLRKTWQPSESRSRSNGSSSWTGWAPGRPGGFDKARSGEEIPDQPHEFLGLLQFRMVAAAGQYLQPGALDRLLIRLAGADWYHRVLLTPDQEGGQVFQPAQ